MELVERKAVAGAIVRSYTLWAAQRRADASHQLRPAFDTLWRYARRTQRHLELARSAKTLDDVERRVAKMHVMSRALWERQFRD